MASQFHGNGFLPDGSFFNRKSGVLYHVTNGKKTEVKMFPP
jgi:hypothetical protein